VRELLPAMPAKLLELYLALHKLLVLARPVIDILALTAREFYQLFLSHGRGTIPDDATVVNYA